MALPGSPPKLCLLFLTTDVIAVGDNLADAVVVGVGDGLRCRWNPTATAAGGEQFFSAAEVAVEPSPVNSASPVPAMVTMLPAYERQHLSVDDVVVGVRDIDVSGGIDGNALGRIQQSGGCRGKKAIAGIALLAGAGHRGDNARRAHPADYVLIGSGDVEQSP